MSSDGSINKIECRSAIFLEEQLDTRNPNNLI